MMRSFVGRMVWVAVLASSPLGAAPLKVLAIGDSLTEEYAFELPFSAPDSAPSAANTRNWPEILSARRAASITFGSYNPSLLSYIDLRNGGYQYNYGVPSFRTADWIAVCQTTFSFDPVVLLRYFTKDALLGHLGEVQAVILFLGGNDLNSQYSAIFNDLQAPAVLGQVVANLAFLHDYVRSRAAGLPIIIATVPDIGATADVAGKFTDPAKRTRARERIAAMNASLIVMAGARGATVARIDSVTDLVFDQTPVHLNGTEFSAGPHPENPPQVLFCKDGFHPATMAQALIADQLIDALNRATGAGIPRLSHREILGSVLGLNPDQPFLDWAGGNGGFFADPDGDGLPNLAEFVLASAPTTAGSPFAFESGGMMNFATSAGALRFASLVVEESVTLDGWNPVPAARIQVTPDGVWRIAPVTASRAFYRMAVTARP
ncbi:SGNH/GDSL hydrolase family protein [bacterium]|nr:SGNH/GDSL hydrolase family protein [bacterium]